ncbi:MAG TPA: hypothetical protein VL549_03745 [Gemmatimonadales bacterium]|jgi:hypothetical protein|nr:hypothetical protein [Gemmatimonadales bacterium]
MVDRPLTDTSPAAQAIMDELYRAMTPAQKLERVRDLTLMANRLALEGLRMRHPGESEQQLLLRLARLRLGDDLVARAYPESASGSGP